MRPGPDTSSGLVGEPLGNRWYKSNRMWGGIIANIFPLALILAWYFAAQNTKEYILPGPRVVLADTGQLLFGDLSYQTYTTFVRVVIAVILALLIAAGLVFLAILFPITEALVGNRILPLLNAIPSLGWAIIGVVWFGVSDAAVILVEVAILVPFGMVNLWEGVRNLDRELLEMGTSFTRRRYRVSYRIEARLLMPYVVAALRLNFSIGWKLALIAEFFGASTGLGIVMNDARQHFDTPMLFAAIFVIIVLVGIFELAVFYPLGKYLNKKMGAGLAT